MKLRSTSLEAPRISKLQNKLIPCLFFFLIATAGATECIVESITSDQFGVPPNGEKVVELTDVQISYWQFLLWLATMNVLVVADLLYSQKLVFSIAGYKIVNSRNVLENPKRLSIYTYIKTKPGAYINEIVEKIGLDREIIKYHIKTLETQNKIEAYREGGRTRFFENNFAYSEEEIKVISALQNVTNQRIISGIINKKYNTNVTIACELKVSRAAVSRYIKNLRKAGLITEIKEGRNTIYKINHAYELVVKKHIEQLQDSYNNEPI